MTEPRMDDKRIAEALERCESLVAKAHTTTEDITTDDAVSFTQFAIDELRDALHDLQDARKRVAELEGALEVAQFEVVELVWVTDSAGRTNRLIVLDRKIREAQAALEGK
ncbi:hypothetical protein LCGC14_1742280 [marine sediment metagenome]|uniref:Uncharacterized protein n=1 Tax=marine sediment metagenome TaxID=412755 RepID=A0A0F9H688_9ZZZZ